MPTSAKNPDEHRFVSDDRRFLSLLAAAGTNLVGLFVSHGVDPFAFGIMVLGHVFGGGRRVVVAGDDRQGACAVAHVVNDLAEVVISDGAATAATVVLA